MSQIMVRVTENRNVCGIERKKGDTYTIHELSFDPEYEEIVEHIEDAPKDVVESVVVSDLASSYEKIEPAQTIELAPKSKTKKGKSKF